MEPDLESALVHRLKDGDVSAFDEIFERFNRRLLTFLWRLSGNRDVAEDLVEETWLRLVGAARKLDAQTRLAPWLFTVARNLYVSHCRSRAREQSYTADLILLWPAGLPRSPLEALSQNRLEANLEAAVAALPPLYREAILLVAIEGMRPTDAAAVCGITPEALRQRLSRARTLLAQHLEASGSPLRNEVTR